VTHPAACLEAVEHGLLHGGEAGLSRERELFLAALTTDTARSLIHLFFAERQAAKVPGISDAGLEPRALAVGVVVGGGTMGSGIATALLDAGVVVRLVETEERRADAARARVERNFARSVEKGRVTADAAATTLARLSVGTDLSAVAGADFVIEAVSEELALKRELFAELGRLARPEALLASNTSTIDIDLLAEASEVPERVLGLHFFSPAHVMKLVEVIRGPRTSPRSVADALGLVKRLKKTSVVVGSCPGFLVNRIFMPYSQLTGLLIDRGVDPYRIDRALVAFGMPMGPNRMSDLAGVDVGVAAGGVLDVAYADRSYRSALRRLLAEAGRLGEKSGAGHYRYVAGRAEEDPELARFVAEARALAGSPPALVLTDDEIAELLVAGVVNEACQVVQEGIVARASDVDVAAVLGMGFPRFRGGPLCWADGIGARRVHDLLTARHAEMGAPVLLPAPLLAERARTGGSLLAP
jgi:enoyl-CoA hydratase/3-hydroxyacyl-CoA dehydrogenase